jgi:hypothetical protein
MTLLIIIQYLGNRRNEESNGIAINTIRIKTYLDIDLPHTRKLCPVIMIYAR